MCLDINEVDFPFLLCPPVLPWQTAFKTAKVKLDVLTAIDMLLMVENRINPIQYRLFGVCSRMGESKSPLP